MKNGIENKVIAITGASSGIGKATAELLADQGAKVFLGARRTACYKPNFCHFLFLLKQN